MVHRITFETPFYWMNLSETLIKLYKLAESEN